MVLKAEHSKPSKLRKYSQKCGSTAVCYVCYVSAGERKELMNVY